MVATVAGIHLGIDTHANRPAGNTVPDGSQYSCSTHSLIYKSNFAGNSWATWATLGGAAVDDATIVTTDVTTNNASTTKHGWLKKLSNVATEYMDGTGAWSVPAGGGGSGEFSEAGAAVLTDATATGDAGSRSDQFPGTSLGGAWSSEAFAVTSLAVNYSTVSIIAGAGGENHQVQAFTPSGAFRLEARMWTTGGSSASIMVRDSGTGIAGEAALFLFIPDSSMGLYTLDAGAYNFRQAATGTYRGGWMYVYVARDGSNNWTGGFSMDRVKWVNTAAHSKTFTVDKMAIRTASGTTGVTGCDFVDVVS